MCFSHNRSHLKAFGSIGSPLWCWLAAKQFATRSKPYFSAYLQGARNTCDPNGNLTINPSDDLKGFGRYAWWLKEFVSVKEFSSSIPKQKGADKDVSAFTARKGVLEMQSNYPNRLIISEGDALSEALVLPLSSLAKLCISNLKLCALGVSPICFHSE